MHLKIIPPEDNKTHDCLREILCLPGAGSLLQREILERISWGKPAAPQLYLPSQWINRTETETTLSRYYGPEGLSLDSLNGATKDGLMISNARLTFRCDLKKLNTFLDPTGSAVVAVEIAPELAAPGELIRRTSQNHIVGYRRILEDVVEPAAILEATFPAVLYFPSAVVQKLGRNDPIPLDFNVLHRRLVEKGIPMRLFRLGGRVCNLSTPAGLLFALRRIPADELNRTPADAEIDTSARLIGPVWLGDGVCIERNAIVAGPVILSDGVHVGSNAVVQNAIVAQGLTIEPGARLQDTLFLSRDARYQAARSFSGSADDGLLRSTHRDWPLVSFPRLGKRVFDLIFSLIILLLISPVLALVALILKLTSPGPVFYRARRQGQHGREFDCLKFRTMMIQADTLQERLRDINQVDGPQFKIDNDPRITGVGKFLRDTCIDELPQFFNVLLGQMSVVGPRPSPENENEACPAWRDARLSVRPGITGLWQVCRTRQAEMDFQEWIHYDTRYVRNLSFRQDLYICFKTAAKLINTFLDQFG